jgi:hypothetical protein
VRRLRCRVPDQWGALFRDLPIARNRFPHAWCGTETRGCATESLGELPRELTDHRLSFRRKDAKFGATPVRSPALSGAVQAWRAPYRQIGTGLRDEELTIP